MTYEKRKRTNNLNEEAAVSNARVIQPDHHDQRKETAGTGTARINDLGRGGRGQGVCHVGGMPKAGSPEEMSATMRRAVGIGRRTASSQSLHLRYRPRSPHGGTCRRPLISAAKPFDGGMVLPTLARVYGNGKRSK